MLVKCGSEVLFRLGRAHGCTQTFFAFSSSVKAAPLVYLTCPQPKYYLGGPSDLH